jgi:hypothetical protein
MFVVLSNLNVILGTHHNRELQDHPHRVRVLHYLAHDVSLIYSH